MRLDLNKLLFVSLFCLLLGSVQGAGLPVSIDSEIYDFLERMENRGIIENYSGIYLPLNRDKVTNYLKQIEANKSKLSSIEKKLYIRFRAKYYQELNQGKKLEESDTKIKFINVQSSLDSIVSRDLKQREQHFLEYKGERGFIWGDFEGEVRNQTKNGISRQLLRGTVLFRGKVENLTGYARFSNHLKLDSKKFNEPIPAEKGRRKSENIYFDNIYAGMGYKNDLIELGFYHQPFLWGVSRTNNLTFSNNGPPFPYLRLSTSIGWLDYTLIHGTLLNDSVSTPNVSLRNRDMPKNVAAQRFQVSLFNSTYIGFNEMVIYCNRTIEPAYLIPFSFYFSTEHYLEDRDNVLLSFDIKSRIIRNVELYASLFLDELKWSELGEQWWANKHALQLGARYNSQFLNYPFNIQAEYTAIRPWTYTHKYFNNNYTHNRYNLGFPYGPNSQVFYFNFNTFFNYRTKLNFEYNNVQHGNDTEEIKYGGEATSNYNNRLKKYDHSTELLMGEISSTHEFSLGIRYEFLNDFYLFGEVEYRNQSIQGNTSDDFYTELGLKFNL